MTMKTRKESSSSCTSIIPDCQDGQKLLWENRHLIAKILNDEHLSPEEEMEIERMKELIKY